MHGYPKTDPRFGVMAEVFGEVMRSTAVQEEFDEDLPVDPEGPIVLAMAWVLPGKETFAYVIEYGTCLLYTSPSPRDGLLSRMPSSA